MVNGKVIQVTTGPNLPFDWPHVRGPVHLNIEPILLVGLIVYMTALRASHSFFLLVLIVASARTQFQVTSPIKGKKEEELVGPHLF